MSFVSIFSVSSSGSTHNFQVIDFDVVMQAQVDSLGVPTGVMRCNRCVVVVRSEADRQAEQVLLEWMSTPGMKKSCMLTVGDPVNRAASRSGTGNDMGRQKIRLVDTYCIGYHLQFTTEHSDYRSGARQRDMTNYSDDAYTIVLTLSPLSVNIQDRFDVNSPSYVVSNAEEGGDSGSGSGSAGSSSESVSSFRAD